MKTQISTWHIIKIPTFEPQLKQIKIDYEIQKNTLKTQW